MDDSEPQKFRPSVISWLLCFAAIGGWLYLHANAQDSAFARESSSYVAGKAFGMLLFAVGGAWLTFKVAKDSSFAASIALPVIFGVLLINATKDVVKDINEDKAEFAKLASQIETAESPEEKVELAKQMMEQIDPAFTPLVETMEDASEPYAESSEVIASDRFLDFALLATTEGSEEYAWQHAAVASHIKESGKFLSVLKDIAKRIDTLGDSSKTAREFRAGFKNKLVPSMSLVEVNTALTTSYGELLTLLESEQGAWTLEDDEVAFEKATAQDEYNERLNKIAEQEETLESLYLEVDDS